MHSIHDPNTVSTCYRVMEYMTQTHDSLDITATFTCLSRAWQDILGTLSMHNTEGYGNLS